MSTFRPWGHIDWLLDRLSSRPWSLLACCGTEPRSIALANYLGRDHLRNADIVTIHDPEPLKPEENKRLLLRHRDSLKARGYQLNEIYDVELLADLDTTRGPVGRLSAKGSAHVIIDITSLPKRWFFPIIQAVLGDSRFENVIVTYTSAISYSDELAENREQLRVLPGFFAENGRSQHESIIVGIGFEPLSLVSGLNEQESNKIRLIFPFPPGPPGHWRNWMFVKQIEELMQKEQIEPPDRVHINMYDCPQVFEALCNMTSNGKPNGSHRPIWPEDSVACDVSLFSRSGCGWATPVFRFIMRNLIAILLITQGGPACTTTLPTSLAIVCDWLVEDLYTLP